MKPHLRAIIAVAAALTLGACTMWKPHAALTPATQLGDRARVTRADGSVVVLPSARRQ
jgi:hypothetical protein